jgi:predicted phosphodiesterase
MRGPRASWSWRTLGLRTASLAAAGLVASAGIVVGWQLAGPTEVETPLGRASLNVAPDASGGVDAYVPIADWGLRADAFDAPFRLEFEIRSIDRRGALGAASGDGEALEDARDELEAAALQSVLRAFLWGLAVALTLALALRALQPRSRRVRALAVPTAALAVAGAAACLALAALTFDARAFSTPSYFGRGQELSQLLAFLERQRDNDRYSVTFEQALRNFSAYLSEAPRAGDEPGRTVLFGSDVHNNALVLPALGRFGDGEPVLLAGDFGHQGNEAEARLIAPRIAALSDQVVAVSGNHDSNGLMQALAQEGVTVLGREGRLGPDGEYAGEPLVEVGELTVAGFPDPLEWEGDDPDAPERVFSFPELDDGEALEDEAKAELVAWFRALPRAPDIVLVHQNALAQHLASELASDGDGRPLTIVTGHNHYPQIDRHGAITVVNAGTLGAGGVLRAGQEPAGLGQLHLQGPDRTLQSVDLIRIEPFSGQAQADRVVLDVVCPPDDDDDEPCHYEPEGL